MNRTIAAICAAGFLAGAGGGLLLDPDGAAARAEDKAEERRVQKESAADDKDAKSGPDLKKKIVPILSVGSSLQVGVAQVQGGEGDVDRTKVVAQIDTDYKDIARIKILVPVQARSFKHIDRVPGVSVSAVATYVLKK